MTQRFDVDGGPVTPQVVLLDGAPMVNPRDLQIIDDHRFPFSGMYMHGVRQYDTEVWRNGNLTLRVPPRTELVDEIYDAIESEGRSISRRGYPTPAQLHADQDGYTARYDAIRAEHRRHPGEAAHWRWQNLRRTLVVHRSNGKELADLLDHVGSSEEISIEMFQNTRPPHVREAVQAGVDQRLHNYVASTSSLIDHTRRVMRHYKGTTLLVEYEKRRSAISTSPEAVFIRDLRNFTQHRELPFVGHTVSLTPGEGQHIWNTKFELSTAALLEWDRWTAPAKRMLSHAGTTVVLRDVMQQHLDLVEALYAWLFAQAEIYHRWEYALADDLRKEVNWCLSGGREGRPRRFGQRLDYLASALAQVPTI